MLEAAFERADEDDATLRFSATARGFGGGFWRIGRGSRASLRRQLHEEGYDGD